MITLRPVKSEDAEMLRAWRNLPQISRTMYTDHYITAEEHSAWFRNAMADSTRRYWIIRCDEKDVGLVNLYAMDSINRRCHWAFYVAESSAKGKGVGSAVELEILRYVFEDMKFNKLCCEVLATNRGVVRMHQSFGFHEEGLFRCHVRKGDDFVDVVCMAILKDEWKHARTELEPRAGKMKMPPGDNSE
jgi:UDP-4-amino-4,6-dideoxy-N-acetyl-beta-L-altrosamine N-acetyltransferase